MGGGSLGTTPTVFGEVVGKREKKGKENRRKTNNRFLRHRAAGVFTKCWQKEGFD